MHFTNTILAAAATFTASSWAAYVVIDYWPDTTDCTGRQYQLEINGDSCNTGNHVSSYKYSSSQDATQGSSINFYIDGSACVDEASSYGFSGDTDNDLSCHANDPQAGSVSFFV